MNPACEDLDGIPVTWILGHDRFELLERVALLPLHQRVEQPREVREVVVDDRSRHAGGAGDRLDRNPAVPVLEDHSQGSVDEMLAPLGRRHTRGVATPWLARGIRRHRGTRQRHGRGLGYRQNYALVAFRQAADYDCRIAATKDISPRVHRLGTSLVNWYLIEDGGQLTAVDAGLPGFKKTLAADLATLGFSDRDIRAVILTHSDADHVGVADELQEAGAPVMIHTKDEPKLRKPGPKSGDASPLKIVAEMWRPSFWRLFGSMLLAGGARPPRINNAETFGDGEVLDVPGRPRVVPTPGHTPGHSAFHFEGHGALFVGDAMCALNPITGRTGPQLMPRPLNESNADALRSLDAIEPIDAEFVLFGHGEPWRAGVGDAVAQARIASQG